MEPGVCGHHGLPAIQIAFNLDVETVIILSLPMGGDTVRAKEQEGWVPVGQDLKENMKKRTEREIENQKEKGKERQTIWAMIWPADTVLVACVNVSFILNKSLNSSI
jgi:hypothetical protein